MAKFNVLTGFHLTPEMLLDYEAKAKIVRANTPSGQMKPPSQTTWLMPGAVYIAGDTIEIEPLEAAELLVIAPVGALEAYHE